MLIVSKKMFCNSKLTLFFGRISISKRSLIQDTGTYSSQKRTEHKYSVAINKNLSKIRKKISLLQYGNNHISNILFCQIHEDKTSHDLNLISYIRRTVKEGSYKLSVISSEIFLEECSEKVHKVIRNLPLIERIIAGW